MLKRVLFLSIGLLFVSGCLPAVDGSGGGSSVLEIPTPTGTTNVKLDFQFSSGNSTLELMCKINPINSSNVSSNIEVSIKNSCILDGEYNITLNITKNGKEYQGTGTINRDTERTKDNKIDLTIHLTAKKGGSTLDVSSNTETDNVKMTISTEFEDEVTPADNSTPNNSYPSQYNDLFKTDSRSLFNNN